MVDLDGDCMGGKFSRDMVEKERKAHMESVDVVFVCQKTGYQTLQLWLNQREGGFKMADELQLPTGAGPVSFADIGMYLWMTWIEPCIDSLFSNDT